MCLSLKRFISRSDAIDRVPKPFLAFVGLASGIVLLITGQDALSTRLYRGFGGLRHVLEATLSCDPTSRLVFEWLLILPAIAVSLASSWARKSAPLDNA
jgi:hypothetical protein